MISTDQITAVIPTHNRLFELERCIKSILPYVHEILVIDNNSTEDIQSLEKKYDEVHVFSVGYNMGPCAATNWGIELSETPYILLVDNDTELLQWSWTYLDMDEDEAVQAFRIFGDKYFHMYSNQPDHPDWYQPLPWFYGCACLVNKKLWQKVGGYNESYFAYYQECDISAQFWKSGFYISYNPSVIFAHHDSESERDHGKMAYWKTRNLLWFSFEHLPIVYAIFQNTKNIASHPPYLEEVLSGIKDALKNMPKREPIKDQFFLKVWRR
jgi:hypothetical protein